ncbi:acyl-CoA dehydrogenase [Rhodococcus sp. WS4]|nr:acyl-CoA dehydrogenase [Rhodococcus sp. WS4]
MSSETLRTTETETSAQERLEAVRDVARSVAKRFPREYWLKCAREGLQRDEMWAALGGAGLLGLRVPEEYGGSGGSVSDLAVVIETLSTAGVPENNLLLTGFARMPILEHGTEEQIARWVVPTIDGRQRMCFALTEPEAGTNSFNVRTSAKKVDGGWSLNGQKVFISNAREADTMLVLGRTGEEGGKPELSLFVLETNTPRISYNKLDIGQLSPENQYSVFFDDVLIPEDQLVGKRGMGLRYLFAGLNPERILTASYALGLGEYALAKAVEYVRTRAPFGRPTGSYQAVQHPLAKAKAELTAARLVNAEAARRYECNQEPGPYAAMAKYLASQAATQACDAAIQVHGGYAFDVESDVATIWPLVRLTQIAPVNNEMILNFIGQEILNLPKSY